MISDGILPSEEIIEEVQLLSSIKDSIEQIKPRGTAKIETRVAYGSITKMIKSIPKATKLKKKLGVNCKVVTTAWWSNEMRKKRKDRIKDDIKSEIREFYLSPEVNREVPVKRECVTVVDRNTCLKTKVHKQVMIMTQGEAYKIYVDKFGKKVGFTSFRNLKPGNVRNISETDRRTCLCTICANVALKAHSIAKYAKLKSNDESSDNLVRLNKMSKEDLVSHTLCHKNGINEYHRVECIKIEHVQYVELINWMSCSEDLI